MFEVTGLFLVMLFIAGCAFLPLGYSIFSQTTQKGQHKVSLVEKSSKISVGKTIPEDSVLRRHCLTNLQSEIQSAFAPRPTDSVLQCHHDTLIATELEKRLVELELTA